MVPSGASVGTKGGSSFVFLLLPWREWFSLPLFVSLEWKKRGEKVFSSSLLCPIHLLGQEGCSDVQEGGRSSLELLSEKRERAPGEHGKIRRKAIAVAG